MAISDLFRQPEVERIAFDEDAVNIEEIYDFPPGRYFVGDPGYAVPREVWDQFLENDTNERFFLEDVGWCVYFSHPHNPDDEGKIYPSDSGLLGIVSVDNISDEKLERLSGLGRLLEYLEGSELDYDDELDVSAFQVQLTDTGSIFTGWNWIPSDEDAESNEWRI